MPRITDFGQVDRLTPDEWLALSYDERLRTVQLVLQQAFPEYYPSYTQFVFVLVEDATAGRLRELAKGGMQAPHVVTGVMLMAVLHVTTEEDRIDGTGKQPS